MKWSIHSTEPMTADKLAAHLEGELEHLRKTGPDGHARSTIPVWDPNAVELQQFTAKQIADRRKSDDAARAPLAAAWTSAFDSRLRAQIVAAIAAAVALAKTMGTNETTFLASLYGHHDPKFSDGIEERINVHVDVAR